MSDEEALLAAVLAHPGEDTPRLVYADWLQEHGDEDRAEFIRLQIERERATAADDRLGTLARKERLLFSRQKAEWLRPLKGLLPGAAVQFRRGFVEELTVQAAHFVRHGDAVCRAHPLRAVRVTQLGGHACEVNRVRRGPGARVYGVLRDGTRWRPEVRVEFFPQAPPALEPELASRRWLVLAWAVGGGLDRRAAEEALLLAGRFRPMQTVGYHVGLRPVADPAEFRTWCPVEHPAAGPHWLLLEDGRLVEDRVGPEPLDRWRDFLAGTPAD